MTNKQTVTFERVQSVTVEFDLEGPMTKQGAEAWANFAFGGQDALAQMMSGSWTGKPPVRTSNAQWTAAEAVPEFQAEPKPKRSKRA